MPIRLSGLASGLDTDALIKGIMDAERLKNKRVTDKKTTLEWQQDKWKELNAKLFKLYTDDLSKLRLQGSYATKKAGSSNENLLSVKAGSNVSDGIHEVEIISLASAQYLTGKALGNGVTAKSELTDLGIPEGTIIKLQNGDKTELFEVKEGATITDFINSAKGIGLNASFSDNRLFISSKASGKDSEFLITTSSSSEITDLSALEGLGLGAGASSQDATDATIKYNGAEFTTSSNEITINGLTLGLKGVTAGEKITINVTNDTEASYNMIKDFVTSFNGILKEMNDLYYAPSSKGYDPLSDEEMEMMTEKQIERWESKIQDSVLRRDSTLGSIIDVMKRSVMGTVQVGGKNFSLSSLGIGTSKDYTEKGLLHIRGDKDDPEFGDLPDVLMKMLQEDPDTVIEGFSKIAGNLYDAMADKMKSIPNVRSAFTFYNDKTMGKRVDQYTKDVSALEKKLKSVEDKYYKQFAAMETAMARLQSQSNALAGMLGMGN